MNYITDGTFWLVVIVIAAVIGIIWYKLKKEIDFLNKSLVDTMNILKEGADDLTKASEKDAKQINDSLAELYENLGLAFQVLGLLEENASKTTRSKIDRLLEHKGEK